MTRRTASLALALLAALGPRGLAQEAAGRQVTLFGIHATPGGGEVDPKLKKIEPQLRKLFPGHNYSFKLLASESKRLTAGGAITCDLGSGFVAGTELTSVLDGEGNIQLRFALELNERTEFATLVRTPPNQLFFCDKTLPDGSKLLIGLGGR